ncbi:MAG: PhzF family phenazine biosynthesis protein [Chloroflexi bacterium]|nr:PhzF family phenazine biosynthesis protein [Chloroflexota bacterium]
MPKRYHFIQADVFTDKPFGGNQLAVFTDARGLTTGEMQALAREMNYSESTFVLPPEIPGAVKRVRIFTPAIEMPMAGHPTVGTTYVLAQRDDIPLAGDVTEATLQLNIGPVKVAIERRNGGIGFVWMTHREPVFGEVRTDRDRVAKALGIAAADLVEHLPIQIVSTGVPFLFVPLRSLDAARRCRVDPAALRELYSGEPVMVYMFTTETTTPDIQIHSRMFAPHVADIPEDPATGAAAGPLGAYVARYQVLPRQPEMRFIIEQGLEMGRPSQIHVEVKTQGEAIAGLRIGGQAVILGEGHIFW